MGACWRSQEVPDCWLSEQVPETSVGYLQDLIRKKKKTGVGVGNKMSDGNCLRK